MRNKVNPPEENNSGGFVVTFWWRRRGLNPRPYGCEPYALPATPARYVKPLISSRFFRPAAPLNVRILFF